MKARHDVPPVVSKKLFNIDSNTECREKSFGPPRARAAHVGRLIKCDRMEDLLPDAPNMMGARHVLYWLAAVWKHFDEVRGLEVAECHCNICLVHDIIPTYFPTVDISAIPVIVLEAGPHFDQCD